MQTAAWARYHLSDPDDFYNAGRRLAGRPDPGTRRGRRHRPRRSPTTHGPGDGQTDRRPAIAPYYQLLQLPGEEDEAEFVLMRPFVPFSEDDQQPAAHRVHGGAHGPGPLRRAGRLRDADGRPARRARASSRPTIQATRPCREQETCWARAGAREVRYGNLLLVPIDDSAALRAALLRRAEGEARRSPGCTNGHRRLRQRGGDRAHLAGGAQRAVRPEVATQEDPDRRAAAGRATRGEPTTPTGTAAEQAPGAALRRRRPVQRGRRGARRGRPGHLPGEDQRGPRARSSEAVDLLDAGRLGVHDRDTTTTSTLHHDDARGTRPGMTPVRRPRPVLTPARRCWLQCPLPTATRGGAVW